jgi:hypothetical protein
VSGEWWVVSGEGIVDFGARDMRKEIPSISTQDKRKIMDGKPERTHATTI